MLQREQVRADLVKRYMDHMKMTYWHLFAGSPNPPEFEEWLRSRVEKE